MKPIKVNPRLINALSNNTQYGNLETQRIVYYGTQLKAADDFLQYITIKHGIFAAQQFVAFCESMLGCYSQVSMNLENSEFALFDNLYEDEIEGHKIVVGTGEVSLYSITPILGTTTYKLIFTKNHEDWGI